jgi:quinol monooxygenase YgiN
MVMGAFTQIIDFHTDDIDEMLRLDREYLAMVDRAGLFGRGQTIRDRNDPTHYFVILEYDSFEQMQETQDTPESHWLAEAVAPLIKGEPTFYHCDVVSGTDDRSES